MLGRTPGNIVAVRPLRQGVISDYTVTEKMLRYFIQKSCGKSRFRKPRISVCVPSGVTEVEKKAVEDATYEAGAREVAIIEEPILIGERTAEEIKVKIGSAYKRPEVVSMDVRGRNLVTGLPKTITVTSDETLDALKEITSLSRVAVTTGL